MEQVINQRPGNQLHSAARVQLFLANLVATAPANLVPAFIMVLLTIDNFDILLQFLPRVIRKHSYTGMAVFRIAIVLGTVSWSI